MLEIQVSWERLVIFVQFALTNEIPGTLTERSGETSSGEWTAAPVPAILVRCNRIIIYMHNETFLFCQPALK